jgi:hypothetical protein
LGEITKKGERRMKNTKFLILLVFSVMLVALALALVKPVAGEDPIIVGKWDRTDGSDVYTIYANHVTQTVLPEGTYHGTWEYDGSSGYKYIFHWEHSPPGKASFIDYVTVAADGQSYSGYNNYGDQFNCVRISSETGSVPAADSGFPIVYVAVGGGIAAIAGVGIAVYYVFFASAKAAEAAGAGGPLLADASSSGGGSSGTGDQTQAKEVKDAKEAKEDKQWLKHQKQGSETRLTSEVPKPAIIDEFEKSVSDPKPPENKDA